MAQQVFKVEKHPQVFTFQKAKTVKGRFGVQLWVAATDVEGMEGVVYLPWANEDGSMSGAVQQFIRTGLIGPEDFSNGEGTYYDQLKDQAFRIERVFKDGKQFINIDRVGGNTETPTQQAARKELSLEEMQKFDTAEFFGKLAAAPALVAQTPTRAQQKPRESANDRYARAFAHVMEVYAAQMAELLDPQLAAVVAAQTATLFIAYEKEG